MELDVEVKILFETGKNKLDVALVNNYPSSLFYGY